MTLAISFSVLVKQIPFPPGTPLHADSENVTQSVPITTVSSGAKEPVKGEEKKVKEKLEKKGILL